MQVAAKWGKWSTTIAISPFDLFKCCDVGIALFLLLKVPITEQARLNQKSVGDIAAVNLILSNFDLASAWDLDL